MKKAFTLIELLVVIAIIAILAAILFPVFAQAKLAAKQSVNLSNHKQLGLAAIMYTVDYDDYFPLMETFNPTDTTFGSFDPWQVVVQPYIKNWGIFQHPLGPSIPSSPGYITAWRECLMYGAMAKAENLGLSGYVASTGVGSFDRRVLGSITTNYEGLFGIACNPVPGASCNGLGYGNGSLQNANVPSYSSSGVGNPSNILLISEGNMWDLWTGVNAGTGTNPCTYGVYWSPGQYDILGTAGQYGMSCPAARKSARGQSPTGACTPANICDGVQNFGIQNGLTTYVATDGHAIAQDYRGGVMQSALLANGTHVIKSMYPQGGY
jgi:prepilin-type N-terminal cleavage/methylation domain-containing protein